MTSTFTERADLSPGRAISGSRRRTLDAIFRHPVPHNLEWRDVVALLSEIGEIEERPNDEFVFSVGAERHTMRKPHSKDLTAPEVAGLNHFLARTTWSPEGSSRAHAHRHSPAPSLVVVIDHQEARVWHVDAPSADAPRDGLEPPEPRHFHHDLAQKDHRLEDGRLGAGDRVFLEEIAGAVANSGAIVVIGHGKGESCMADQLAAYLQAHHNETYARIVKEIVADIPNMTTAQLLDLGRHALEQASPPQ